MNKYTRYLLQRLVIYGIVVFGALVINFLVPRFAPGNPLAKIMMAMRDLGVRIGGGELIEQYKRMFGLEGDYFTQFVAYLVQLSKGNLGYSISSFPATVDTMVARALPYTIVLLSVSAACSWLVGTLLGAIGGWRGGHSRLSQIVTPVALVLYAVPYYMLALILVFLLAYTIPIFPISRAYSLMLQPNLSLSFIADYLYHMILPVLSILLSGLGWWYLSMKSMITNLKGEDFILLAEAKGLKKRRIMWKYAFRNALLPQTTGLALALGNIAGGALLTEVIFSYQGMGSLLYLAILNADYPLMQGVTLIITLSVCTATLLIDLTYPLIDPRIKYGRD